VKRKIFKNGIQNIVIKVGTSVLTRNGRFDKTIIRSLAAEVAAFRKKGTRVAIVSSGAIGAGMMILKEKKRPKTMEGLQAAAAVGQRYLMQCYEEAFSKRGFSSAQVLLTWEDLAHPKRFMNAKRTIKEIQKRKLVPVINENDTVATDEIRFGDNDRLSALLSILVEADALVILSDTDGLRSSGGEGSRIKVVEEMDKSVYAHVRDSKNSFTVGGMRSKLKAIETSTSSGIPVFLAHGHTPKVLCRLFAGDDLGTFFLPLAKKERLRKNWTYHFLNHMHLRKK
jgi:glutamate 5-kinase